MNTILLQEFQQLIKQWPTQEFRKVNFKQHLQSLVQQNTSSPISSPNTSSPNITSSPNTSNNTTNTTTNTLNNTTTNNTTVNTSVDALDLKKHLEIYNSFLNNDAEKKYPLKNTSLLQFLPPEKTFQLLDEYAQDILRKETTWSFFAATLRNKFRKSP